MKAISDETLLAGKIPEVEARLEQLEREVEEIGMPAASGLKRRLERLRIEERALRRNLGESRRRGGPDAVRRRKIDALRRHIEREEASVGHEADFLHQSAPSSVSWVAGAAARGVEICRRGIRKLLGGRHPLGESVFVNRTAGQLDDFGTRRGR
jgi:ABC-type phosphate transport system auxiliary subunit